MEEVRIGSRRRTLFPPTPHFVSWVPVILALPRIHKISQENTLSLVRAYPSRPRSSNPSQRPGEEGAALILYLQAAITGKRISSFFSSSVAKQKSQNIAWLYGVGWGESLLIASGSLLSNHHALYTNENGGLTLKLRNASHQWKVLGGVHVVVVSSVFDSSFWLNWCVWPVLCCSGWVYNSAGELLLTLWMGSPRNIWVHTGVGSNADQSHVPHHESLDFIWKSQSEERCTLPYRPGWEKKVSGGWKVVPGLWRRHRTLEIICWLYHSRPWDLPFEIFWVASQDLSLILLCTQLVWESLYFSSLLPLNLKFEV